MNKIFYRQLIEYNELDAWTTVILTCLKVNLDKEFNFDFYRMRDHCNITYSFIMKHSFKYQVTFRANRYYDILRKQSFPQQTPRIYLITVKYKKSRESIYFKIDSFNNDNRFKIATRVHPNEFIDRFYEIRLRIT